MMHEDEQSEDDDRAVFRHAMRDVVPLKPSKRAQHTVRPARTRSGRGVRGMRSRGIDAERLEALAPGADLYEVQPHEELLFRRAGVPETVLRRLRRGQHRVEAEIDLHGMVVAEASPRLDAFIHEAQAEGLRCVRVIHGKGLRSGTRGPIIKNTVNAQLRRSDAVLAFVSARPLAGGTGATLVLLNRP